MTYDIKFSHVMAALVAMTWLNTQATGFYWSYMLILKSPVLMRSCQQGTLLSPKQATHKSLHKEIPHKGTIVFPIGSYTNTYLHTGIQSLAFAVYKYTASLTVLAYINSGGELPCMLNTQLFNTKKQTR